MDVSWANNCNSHATALKSLRGLSVPLMRNDFESHGNTCFFFENLVDHFVWNLLRNFNPLKDIETD